MKPNEPTALTSSGQDEIEQMLKRLSIAVEECAYSVAGNAPTVLVSELILLAAELDRVSDAMANRQD